MISVSVCVISPFYYKQEVDLEVIELYRECKREGRSRAEFLRLAANIKGVYVPSLYDISYNDDGTINAITPLDGAPGVTVTNSAEFELTLSRANSLMPFVTMLSGSL